MIGIIQKALFFIVIFQLVACSDSVTRRKQKKPDEKSQAVLPVKDTKVVWIIPAGAGAMRVSLGIFQAMEKELGTLDPFIDMVGGVSSGALAGAGLTYGNPPKKTPKSLKDDLGTMLKAVFPQINKLGDKLMSEGFTLDELEAIYQEISNSSNIALDFSSPQAINNTFATVFLNAVLKEPSMIGKLNKLIDSKGDLKPDIAGLITGFSATTVAQNLGAQIDQILGPSTINHPENAKLISIASYNKEPVFFANQSVAQFLPGPYAESTTPMRSALIATAAIPKIIDAPNDINFHQQGGGLANLTNLQDGFFAVGNRFDPSAIFYDIFTKLYEGQNILIIYVGNGAKEDKEFRNKHGIKKGDKAQKEVGGKKITFIAIDTQIISSKGNDLFNLSGFYANEDLFALMDKAAQKATETEAFAWALQALRAIKQ